MAYALPNSKGKDFSNGVVQDVVYSRYHSALRTQLRRWYFSEMLTEGLLRLDLDIKTLVLAEFGTAKAEK